MAIVKIHDIVLYTTDAMNELECFKTVAWLDQNKIPYIRLHYNQYHPLNEVEAALNTWWPGKEVTYWPFVVFHEQHEGKPITQLTANFIEGFENIKEQLPELVALGQ